MKQGIVENYDCVEIRTHSGKDVIRYINVKKRQEDENYLGLKLGDWFCDRYGHIQQIVGIEKNDPYEGMADIVPKLAVDNYDEYKGKRRRWGIGNAWDEKACYEKRAYWCKAGMYYGIQIL